jgi:SAM-dependent methyltransferase
MDELTQARRVLDAIGPRRTLLVGPKTDALAVELRRLGCKVAVIDAERLLAGAPSADQSGVDAVLWSWDAGFRMPTADALSRSAGSAGGVFVLLREPSRAAPAMTELYRAALAKGWRRSLCDWSVPHYRELDHPRRWSELYLEPFPGATGEAPLPPALTDPTRAVGSMADAALARHAVVAEWVRPGDHVLAVGCGSGAGAALLAQRSRCASVTGIDACETAIGYARRHFGRPGLVAFDVAVPQRMSPVADRSIDLLVAIDLFDDGADADAVVAEFSRVLKPDGRLVVSALDRQMSAGLAAARLQALLGGRFLIEARHRQPVPNDQGSPRTIDRIALHDDVPRGGWHIVVAASNPLGADRAGFQLPEFARLDAPALPVTDFGTHYDNPWLYRPMVQMGQRLQDERLLTDFALEAHAQADACSADAGAALCVIAYQVLGRRRVDQVENLLPLIDAYAAQASTNPHVLRWQISLEFAAALGCLTTGEMRRAEDYFERVTLRDPLAFSPLLATKTVAASFWLGIRRLVERQHDRARQWFESGVRAAARALQAPIEGSISSLSRPNTFGFQELAEIADMAGQCAQALDALGHFDAAPGRFWRQVDTRRFGLATWLLHLERENRELRQQMQATAKQDLAPCH